MPSIFTHDTFGREVYKRLPKDIQENLAGHMRQFRIGLQGPDFLFFYHPLIPLFPNKLGHKLHKLSASEIVEPMLPMLCKAGYNSAEYAYILGFLCHFMLDSTCHDYVVKKSKRFGYNHLVMEMELDRHFLLSKKKDPLRFPVYRFVPRDEETIDAMAHVYEGLGLTRKQVEKSLKGMYFYKRLFTAGKGLKRFFIRFVMMMSLHYHKLEGHMMNLVPKKTAPETNDQLITRYHNAVDETVSLLKEFHPALYHIKSLNHRFDSDFLSLDSIKERN